MDTVAFRLKYTHSSSAHSSHLFIHCVERVGRLHCNIFGVANDPNNKGNLIMSEPKWKYDFYGGNRCSLATGISVFANALNMQIQYRNENQKENTGMEGHNAMRSKSHEVGFASLQITENSLLVWRYRMNRTCVFRSLNTIGVKFHAIYLQSLAKWD